MTTTRTPQRIGRIRPSEDRIAAARAARAERDEQRDAARWCMVGERSEAHRILSAKVHQDEQRQESEKRAATADEKKRARAERKAAEALGMSLLSPDVLRRIVRVSDSVADEYPGVPSGDVLAAVLDRFTRWVGRRYTADRAAITEWLDTPRRVAGFTRRLAHNEAQRIPTGRGSLSFADVTDENGGTVAADMLATLERQPGERFSLWVSENGATLPTIAAGRAHTLAHTPIGIPERDALSLWDALARSAASERERSALSLAVLHTGPSGVRWSEAQRDWQEQTGERVHHVTLQRLCKSAALAALAAATIRHQDPAGAPRSDRSEDVLLDSLLQGRRAQTGSYGPSQDEQKRTERDWTALDRTERDRDWCPTWTGRLDD